MEDKCPDWFDDVNNMRRTYKNPDSLPSHIVDLIGSPEFQECAKARARRAAASSGLVVFIGAGDLSSTVIRNLSGYTDDNARSLTGDNRKHIVTVAIDTKISVASSYADYFFQLKDKQALWDDRILIALLEALLPRKRRTIAGSLPNQVAHILRRDRGFALLHIAPMLIGDYHGFNVKAVFEAAERLGYQVMPDKDAAIRAMDKRQFWLAYHNHPLFAEHLLKQEVLDIPPRVVDVLLSNSEFSVSEELEQFMKEAEQKVRSIGWPCMLKPAISEFGYAQVKLEDIGHLGSALRIVVEQCRKYWVNPGYRVVIESFVERKVVDRLTKGRPVELLQIVLRHLNGDGKLISTCLPPIWFVNYQSRTYGGTDLVAGPQVFDFAIQAPARALPELLSDAQYIEIRQKSIQLVESMTKAPGLFGLEIFLTSNGEFKFNRVSVRTQDTMFATLPTPQTNAFALLAKVIQNERIDDDQLLIQTCISGVKTIVWEEDETGRILDFQGKKDAEQVENVWKVDIYTEKRELRPLRRFGLIQVCVPIEADIGADDVKAAIDKVRISMEEARRRINIVADLDQ